MRQFLLPDLGEGLEEAEIVTWHVNEGDHVVTDQPLVSVETDKAVVEVPSPQSGRIAHLFGAKGDLVKVGTPLVEFAEGAEQDTGTVVGQLDTSEKRGVSTKIPTAPATGRMVQVLPAVRALARKLDVDLNAVQALDPAAPSRGLISSGPRKVSQRQDRPRPCAGCGARWPSVWLQHMPK